MRYINLLLTLTLTTETRENNSKQWRHSWSTTPTLIPALWLAATSYNLVQPRKKMNMFISGCSHIAVASQLRLATLLNL